MRAIFRLVNYCTAMPRGGKERKRLVRIQCSVYNTPRCKGCFPSLIGRKISIDEIGVKNKAIMTHDK